MNKIRENRTLQLKNHWKYFNAKQTWEHTNKTAKATKMQGNPNVAIGTIIHIAVDQAEE